MGALLLVAAGSAAAQEASKPSETKAEPADALLGSWSLRIDAGEEVYVLTVTFKKESDGALTGTMSEANGWFADIPLAGLSWDGTILKYQVVTATPPDGAERPWYTEMKLAEEGLTGVISLPDLGMVLPASGNRI